MLAAEGFHGGQAQAKLLSSDLEGQVEELLQMPSGYCGQQDTLLDDV